MHPVAFQIGGFTIYWYGILAAAGFLAGFWIAGRRALREGIRSEDIVDLAPWLLGGTIIGARAWYVVYYWDSEFAGKPYWEVFMIRRSGLVFYGGLIGASLATIVYTRLRKLPLWKIADILAPSIALGHGFGRVGCLMTGCCYGHPTSLPWAVHFPSEHWSRGEGVHPTQIYESILNLALFGGLSWFYPRKKFDGQVFGVYLVAYAVLRAFVELFRGDYTALERVGSATPGQWVSGGILIAGLFLLWKLPALSTASPNPKRCDEPKNGG
ncbi:MAG: prolipoprotein diacylglyceryl transferase [Verrucomicrobia bacterium]|nr:prolipoprotein diacylglyceryl transferase [Verrucomicrobiota bacterium]